MNSNVADWDILSCSPKLVAGSLSVSWRVGPSAHWAGPSCFPHTLPMPFLHPLLAPPLPT